MPSTNPWVVVSNYGEATVEGFELITSFNDHEPFTSFHAEAIPPGESREVMLPELKLRPAENTLNLEVKLLGNVQDDYASNDSFAQSFDLESTDFWTFTLNTDTWANEVSWRIEDSDGNVLMDGGDYEVGSATYVEQGCIPVGCHTLIMEDSNADGLCQIDFGDDGICDVGGSMTLTDAAGNVLVELDNTTNNYGSLGTWQVCASQTSSLEGCEDANNNGICDDSETSGCTDAYACNFLAGALNDDGSCSYPESHLDCDGNCISDLDGDGICDPFEIPGCADETACNFRPEATDDDGSCTYPDAGLDCEGDCLNDLDEDGVCDEHEIPGCADETACNFRPEATDDDGSCTYPEAGLDCDGNCLNDVDEDGICDEFEIPGCTDNNACNFDESATEDDGSCEFPAPGTDCQGSTSDLGDPSQNAPFSLFPNPLSPEHAMVHVSGLTDETTPIRVLASDGRVVWQGTGIKTSQGVIGYPIRESISPGTYFIQVGSTSPSGNIALMVW
jgi:hypothetical protein